MSVLEFICCLAKSHNYAYVTLQCIECLKIHVFWPARPLPPSPDSCFEFRRMGEDLAGQINIMVRWKLTKTTYKLESHEVTLKCIKFDIIIKAGPGPMVVHILYLLNALI